MIPQEKAQELVSKYYKLAESIEWADKETMQKAELLNDELGQDVLFYWHELAKQSALIACDEILNALANTDTKVFEFGWHYWKEVKQQINQL